MATSPAETPASVPPADASGARPGAALLEALYQEHFDFIWKCARAFGAASADIDDVVQDVFLVVQRRYDELRHEALTRSWIYGITRRVVSTHRRRRRETESVELDALKSPAQSPHAVAEHNGQVRVLSALLDALDERKREVFVLSEILELSGREIAETLGIPMNTVYSRLRVAKEEFDAAARRHRKSTERRRPS